MIIKKFTAKTEEEATREAKSELGENAVVMNVRTVKPGGLFGFFKRAQVEVTAAVEEVSDTTVSNSKPVQLPPYRPEGKSSHTMSLDRGVKDTSEIDLSIVRDAARKIDENERQLESRKVTEEKKEEEDISREKKTLKESGDSSKAISEKLDSIHSLIEKQIKSEHGEDTSSENEETKEEKESDEINRFLDLISDTLKDNEVDEKYVKSIVEEARQLRKPGVSIDYMLSGIYQRLILKFGEAATIEKNAREPEAVFFLGPTGVGKTTTIAKIASRLVVHDKKRVALVTTDTYRVKAAEQLRTYADILNVPFRIVYVDDDMRSALNEFKNFDFVLVDTAGHSPKNNEQIGNQKQFIDLTRDTMKISVYLVVSVTTKYRDLLNIADTYSKLVDYRIIFTKLDETTTLGNMLNLKLHTGAEISYVTNGQDVPDDMEVFDAQKTVRVLLGGKGSE
ncbi:MAG: flagellar biosynthesis protein FlhF [Lachnospiraceae bacterium]|nr:flagellar biosynthesis protein FlhF [Lachnospiraceae bacterium]